MKPRIVEFENGKFGIQVSRFPNRFRDLKTDGYFAWRVKHIEFIDCQGTLEECQELINRGNIKRVVK